MKFSITNKLVLLKDTEKTNLDLIKFKVNKRKSQEFENSKLSDFSKWLKFRVLFFESF